MNFAVYKTYLARTKTIKDHVASNPRGILHHRRCWNTKDRDVAHKGVTPQSADQQLHRVTSSHPGVAVIPHHTTPYHNIPYYIISYHRTVIPYHVIPYRTTSISTMIQSCHSNVETWRLLEGCLDLMLGIFHGSQTVLQMMSVTAIGFSLIRLVCWRGQRYEDLKNMVCVTHVIHLHIIYLLVRCAKSQIQRKRNGLQA